MHGNMMGAEEVVAVVCACVCVCVYGEVLIGCEATRSALRRDMIRHGTGISCFTLTSHVNTPFSLRDANTVFRPSHTPASHPA